MNEEVKKELEEIRKKNNGILYPSKVVEYAEDPKTALHSRFEWNNNKAAHEYRLWQARQLIRVVVLVPPVSENNSFTVNIYENLPSDIDGKENGYRHIEDVMASETLYQQLLESAKSELKRVKGKYERVKELQSIWEAINKVA